jgi:uncharacterized damage-inducible protein DinB
MDCMATFRRLFEYDYWGNRQALESLASVNAADGRALEFFNHIIGAEEIWLARFATPEPRSINVWPKLSLEECRGAVKNLHREWMELLDRLSDAQLAERLAYRNMKGVEFLTPIQDILTHLVMHSAYHRGQVAAAVRRAGGKPAATDYIAYVRQMHKA